MTNTGGPDVVMVGYTARQWCSPATTTTRPNAPGGHFHAAHAKYGGEITHPPLQHPMQTVCARAPVRAHATRTSITEDYRAHPHTRAGTAHPTQRGS